MRLTRQCRQLKSDGVIFLYSSAGLISKKTQGTACLLHLTFNNYPMTLAGYSEEEMQRGRTKNKRQTGVRLDKALKGEDEVTGPVHS